MMENNLRLSLVISQGDAWIFIRSPIRGLHLHIAGLVDLSVPAVGRETTAEAAGKSRRRKSLIEREEISR
jgi:TctA family transporter